MKIDNPKFLAKKHMGSQTVQLIKIHFLSRADANDRSELLSKSLIDKCKSRNIKLTYDVSYGGYPNELRYSEFFAGLGGIQVLPCAGDMVRMLYSHEYDKTNNIDFSTIIGPETYDKYLVHDYDIRRMRGLIILPGSNLLKDVVDKEKLNSAVLLGATIKPHPLTNQEDINFLLDQYGPDVVMPKLYSGYKAMVNSNVIYASCTTELALYAMLMGKHVINIGTGFLGGGYLDVYNAVINAPNQKDALNEVLNNPASGIIFDVDQIDTYLDIYEKTLEYYMTEDMIIPPLNKYDVV